MAAGAKQSVANINGEDLANLISAAIAGGASTLGDVVTELQSVVASLADVDLNTDGIETLLSDLKTLLTTPGGKTLKFAVIDETGTDQEIIAAAGASKSIRVCVLHFMVTDAAGATVTFKSGSTAITGATPYPAGGGVVLPFAPPMAVLKTADNEALKVTVSAGSIKGFLVYWDSDAA